MPLSIVSTEPESSSANQLSVVSSKPVPKVTSADIERIAKQYDVPADLAVGVAHIESANDPLATSNKGAQGIMQLMPDTAKRYGVTDSYDPEQNITGGVKYLKDLLKQFNGDREKALAAYNWGEKHVADGKEVPSSVQQYVKDVSGKAKEHAWSNLKVVLTEPETAEQSRGGKADYTPEMRLQYAKPGPYVTKLSPQDEQEFQSWVKKNNVPFEDDGPKTGYDLRGFWKASKEGDPAAQTALNPFDHRIHYSDKWKTPYSTEGFSRQSIYAKPNAPQWYGDDNVGWRLIDDKGNILDHQGDKDEGKFQALMQKNSEGKKDDKKPTLSIVSTAPESQSLPGQEKPMAGAPQDWAKQALAQSGVTAPVAGPAAPPPIPSRVGYITGAPVPPTPNIEEINKKQDEANQKMFTHPLIPHGEEMVEEHRKLAETVDAKKHPVIAWLADADVVGAQTLVGLSTPANLALLGVMALAPEASVVKRLVDAGFSVQMAKQAYEQFKSGQKAKEQGNDREAHRQWMGGALSAIFSGLAGHGATKGEKIIGSKEEPVHAETPETIEKQIDALKAGTVSTVMIPQGGEVPAVPEGMQSVAVDKGKGSGTYIFDPKKISAETIRQAAESGKHGELLGHVQSKAEVADKPKVVVQARAEDGTPVQESVVENKPEVVAAQTRVLEDRHPDAEVTVTTPQEVLGERAGVPVEQREAADEGKEAKYSYGSTQADIPEDSEAAHALTAARQRISDADLAGKGRDVGGNHVTVRYGIDSDDTAGVREFLSQQKPFYATLGKTEKFEPSKSSDGAAVINAPIEAPELHRINDELENHGDFIKPTFDEYKPHATVAYVKPEAADRYVGMDVTSGKKFLIDRVAITNRNGDQVIVPLEGKEPGTEANQPTTNKTEPASIIKVPIGSLVLDPNRFQYKLNVDEKGVSNILKGRKWNPDLAGVVSVWQDPHDEELYVVNGHHRVDLARDNGVQNLDVRVINADNAKEARSIGALQNIAEGRGTAVDAAKFFRDTGRGEKDLENEGITLSESKAADGVALAKLSQPIFDEVAQGRMRVGRGVAIGNATDDPAQQEAILKMIEKREKSGKAIPDSVVAELGRMAKGAKDKTETQDTLFGVQSMTRNLLLEKAEVSDYIRKQIGSEKKLFTTVGTESTAQRLGKAGNVIDAGENAKIAQQAAQAQELYDRFSVKTGEINDILNRAADELSNGESPNAVKQRAYEETRATLSQTIGQGVENRGEGVQAGPRTGEAEAHAEPAAGEREGAVKGPLTEVKLRAELAKHPNIMPEQRDAMVAVWKQFSEKYLGMDFDQFLNRYWKDFKVGGEYAGEEGLQQRGAVTWAYHPQKGLLTDRAGRKGHEQLLHEAGVDYMGGRAYDRLPRGRAIVDPYTKSVVVTLQGEGDLTPAAERELRHALDVPGDYTVRTNHGALFQQGDAVKGATQFMADGKAIVRLYNSADFSTFAHESFHVMRPHLKPEDTAILEREFGVKDGKWTREHEESAARSWERYLRDGEAPSPKLADVFAKIKAWMVGIYQHLAGTELDKNVSPAVREVFDRMLGKEDSVSAETGEQPRPLDPNQEVMFQRRKRAETEPSGLLPGMEEVPEERKQAAAEAEGETLTGELTQPKGDISRAAGEMEQRSPLFRGTEASPQNEMFGDEGQTKLFSGIPPPEEFVKQFRTVFPSVAKRFDDWVSGEPTIGGEQKATMRQTRGEMDRALGVVAEKLKSYKKEWVARPREDFRKFAQAVEGLIPVDQLSPRDQELANIFKSGFDEIRSQIRALKPEVLQSYIEHYFPHIWERPSVAEKAVRNVLASKRPFAGSERFRQKRTVPTIEDGLDLGLNPVSWNPVDMFLLKYKEEAQFLMAHKTLDMMKDNGNAKFVRINQASPEGWVKLDDRIGTVYGKEQVQTVEPGQDELYDEGGKPRSFTVIRGHYWAPPEAAKVFNNFVSRGFAGRYTTYDIAQGLNSNLNALQLGISAFHVTTTSVNAATSDIALGLQQLREGKIVEGATRIGSGVATLPSVANTLRNGSKLMKEYLTPGSYEKFSREANAVEQAGGRAKQQTIQIPALNRLRNALSNHEWKDAAKASIPAAIEASVWPVMEYYVPRMKFGAFYNMAHDILERADRENWPEERTRARMQKAWDSVDNRFGQMVYDNLFWKKSVRDSLQLATRSVGWNFGTIRELGGAVPDLIKETARVSKGEAPEISDRVAFAFALAGYTAMVGATMTYLMTGKRPQTWKDYYYPRQADGTRMSIPGYMKDVVAYMHDPKQTVMNKMGPLIELTAEAIQNRDFYGTEIRHKDDPAIRQLWQLAKFVGNTAMPFSISGSKKLVQKAGGDTSSFKETVKSGLRHPGQIMAGQFGFQPAPAFIQHSPALNKAYEYEFENRPPGIRTQAQADHHQYMRQMEDMYRSGKVDQKTIDSLLANNQITHADVRKAKVVSRLDPLAWAAFSLTLEQALNVYKDADEREKKILKPIIIKKRSQISKEPDPDKRAELMRSYLQTVHPQGK